jgi:hypothetical protein
MCRKLPGGVTPLTRRRRARAGGPNGPARQGPARRGPARRRMLGCSIGRCGKAHAVLEVRWQEVHIASVSTAEASRVHVVIEVGCDEVHKSPRSALIANSAVWTTLTAAPQSTVSYAVFGECVAQDPEPRGKVSPMAQTATINASSDLFGAGGLNRARVLPEPRTTGFERCAEKLQ